MNHTNQPDLTPEPGSSDRHTDHRVPNRVASRVPSRVLGVIPARLASTRLPRKVLRELAGEPLLAWVYRAAKACPGLDQIVIATDSLQVQQLCERNGWPSLMTSPDLPSGTDRLHAVSQLPPWQDFDIYVNIQGDEPLLEPAHIAALLSPFAATHSSAPEHVDVTTLKVRCTPENISNPNAVKVVTAADGRALYFSRAPIPYDRNTTDSPAGHNDALYWKHLGLYAYRRSALARFAALPPGELEQIERLEQLRLLENNIALYVAETEHDTIGVDTEDDLRRVEAILLQRQP
jgi:3-deoxy-manno-octulosonate cytidylyltransferase (CMP-KDO synthetase)